MYATAANTLTGAAVYSEKAAVELVRKSTAFETVHSALGEVSRVEGRLYSLMSRLVGDMPSDASGAIEKSPIGLLPELEAMGQGIHRSVFRMDEMLSAIERALP